MHQSMASIEKLLDVLQPKRCRVSVLSRVIPSQSKQFSSPLAVVLRRHCVRVNFVPPPEDEHHDHEVLKFGRGHGDPTDGGVVGI